MDAGFSSVLAFVGADVVMQEPPGGSSSRDFIRHAWALSWISEHSSEIDRIFWFDAFDIFFQGDPFGAIPSDSLVFFSEGFRVGHPLRGGPNADWVRECFGEEVLNRVQEGQVINGGTAGGPADLYVRFLSLLLFDATPWNVCSLDQPRITVHVELGTYARHGIKTRVHACEGPVLSLYACGTKNVPYRFFGESLYQIQAADAPWPALVLHDNGGAKRNLLPLFGRCDGWRERSNGSFGPWICKHPS